MGERLTVNVGIEKDLHTFTAQYGRGDYSYSLGEEKDGFDVSPNGELSADNTTESGEYTLTVWVEDHAGNRAQTAVRVHVIDFHLAEVPRLFGVAGIAKVLHTITTDGGMLGEQYTMVAGNTGYFSLDADSGVLSLLTTAVEGVYTLSVEVSDSSSLSRKATVVATVEVESAALAVAQSQRLEVTAGVAKEVYVFEASGGVMPHTYTLLHNPAADAFAFSNGTLSVNVSATIGEYRFTVAVSDAASMTVTVAATVVVQVESAVSLVLSVSEAQPGIAGDKSFCFLLRQAAVHLPTPIALSPAMAAVILTLPLAGNCLALEDAVAGFTLCQSC